jgi:hypothetical protein
LIENDNHPPEADFATLNTVTEENVKVKMKNVKLWNRFAMFFFTQPPKPDSF